MENLKLIVDNDELTVYRCSVGEIKVILLYDNKTDEVFISTSDLAKLLNYPDEKIMLGNDKALDILNLIMKETGKFPIQDNLANLNLLRKIPFVNNLKD
jgi:hypothetical protein